MSKLHFRRALIAAVGLSIAVAPLASAQEQAGEVRITSSITGFMGNQGIRTNPATVVGVGYVHPSQVDTGAINGDFVAIGTSNGLGVSSCADDYDPNWTIYADGVVGGIYWCDDYTQDIYGAGANPTFQITYQVCPAGSGIGRWALIFNGTLRRCQSQGTTTGAAAAAFLETTGASTTDRNIDIKFTNMKIRISPSATFVNMNPNFFVGPSPSYSVTSVSGTAFNAFLAPLD